MQNHMEPTLSMVVKGIAPLECLLQMKKLMKTPTPSTIPGYRVAVSRAAALTQIQIIPILQILKSLNKSFKSYKSLKSFKKMQQDIRDEYTVQCTVNTIHYINILGEWVVWLNRHGIYTLFKGILFLRGGGRRTILHMYSPLRGVV